MSSPNGSKSSKARDNDPDAGVYAIKKFKADKEAEAPAYTGISQSAMREIAVSAYKREGTSAPMRR
jgi:cyclin-dependent kinase 8/11